MLRSQVTIPKKSSKGKPSRFITISLFFSVLLIGSQIFTLHQLAKNQPSVTINITPDKSILLKSGDQPIKLFIASQRGKAYYYPWCSGAANISEGNKIWFANQIDAQNAGYVPAKSCKDLLQ